VSTLTSRNSRCNISSNLVNSSASLKELRSLILSPILLFSNIGVSVTNRPWIFSFILWIINFYLRYSTLVLLARYGRNFFSITISVQLKLFTNFGNASSISSLPLEKVSVLFFLTSTMSMTKFVDSMLGKLLKKMLLYLRSCLAFLPISFNSILPGTTPLSQIKHSSISLRG
jgi:hypothetical protein